MKVTAPFALQAATLSCGSDDHIKLRSRLQLERRNSVANIPSTFVLNTLTLKYGAYFSLLHPVYFNFV